MTLPEQAGKKSKEVTFDLELEGIVGVTVGRGKMAFLAERRALAKVGSHASSLPISPSGFLLSIANESTLIWNTCQEVLTLFWK